MLQTNGRALEVIDKEAALTLDESARQLARRMEEIYDMANVTRRAKSETNRKNTSDKAIPNIDIGDFVLYAKHKKDTKLDYTWLGPAVITKKVTPLVYRIRPYTLYESQTFDVHVKRLRRFASKGLNITEQLRLSVERDHPDNIVQAIQKHEMRNDTLYMQCRWKGFTKAMDSWQAADSLADTCPDMIREYAKEDKTKTDRHLTEFMERRFPSLQQETEEVTQRQNIGEVAKVKK